MCIEDDSKRKVARTTDLFLLGDPAVLNDSSFPFSHNQPQYGVPMPAGSSVMEASHLTLAGADTSEKKQNKARRVATLDAMFNRSIACKICRRDEAAQNTSTIQLRR